MDAVLYSKLLDYMERDFLKSLKSRCKDDFEVVSLDDLELSEYEEEYEEDEGEEVDNIYLKWIEEI